MGRPKLYTTEAERKAAQLASYQRYNAKRYAKVDFKDYVDVPGLIVKQTKTKTYFISEESGKTISGNKIAKALVSKQSIKVNRNTEVASIMMKRANQAQKRMVYEVRYMKKTQRDAETELYKSMGRNAKDSLRIYRNRLDGAKLAIRVIVEPSLMFTEEQKELLFKHSENFSKISPQGEEQGFWEIYNEVAYGPRGKQMIRTDAGVLKLREMFETQLGETYTKTFLKFLY